MDLSALPVMTGWTTSDAKTRIELLRCCLHRRFEIRTPLPFLITVAKFPTRKRRRVMSPSIIDTRVVYIPPAECELPALALHIISLVDSYMLWLGVTEELPDTVQNAPRSGSLCKDWACAMPPPPGSKMLGPASPLFRTSGSDVALSMAQRLALKFRKQIFLSVDIPSVHLAVPYGSRLLLDAEQRIVEVLGAS